MANLDSNELRRRHNRPNNSANPSESNSLDVNIPMYPYESSAEYAAAVNQWLWQCYNFQYLSVSLPYLMSQTARRIQNTNSDGATDFNRNFPNTFFPNQNFSVVETNRANVNIQTVTESESQRMQGRIYVIPSIFKRFIAEAIDFGILLVLKVLLTYVAVDFFGLVNLEKYNFHTINKDQLDYQIAMEVTSEILTLEVVHRFIVCIFEALFLQKGYYGSPGGATPGKAMMKLRVITCESVEEIDSSTIRVIPAGNLGFGWALVRSFVKNYSYAFIFPVCCTMYFFQHNRTAYDHIAGSIVVEEPPYSADLHNLH